MFVASSPIYRIRETYENIPSIGARQAPREIIPSLNCTEFKYNLLPGWKTKSVPIRIDGISYYSMNNNKTRKIKREREEGKKMKKKRRTKEFNKRLEKLNIRGNFFRELFSNENEIIQDINRPIYIYIDRRKRKRDSHPDSELLYGPSLVLQSVDLLSRN